MKTGDRVVCVNASPNSYTNRIPLAIPLVLGREYIIYNILECACGVVNLDVGFVCNLAADTICTNCGFHAGKSEVTWWFGDSRFRKVEEKREYMVVKSNIEIEETILS